MEFARRIAAAHAPRRLPEGGVTFDENALADAIEAYAAEERQAGRIAVLREVLGHEITSGTWSGVIMAVYVHRLLAEAESGDTLQDQKPR